jgi:transcriptional regulator with XRE-family HTH domain
MNNINFIKNKLAAQIKAARKICKLSQQQLSKKSGVSSSIIAVTECETTTFLPTIDELMRLAEALGLTVDISLVANSDTLI